MNLLKPSNPGHRHNKLLIAPVEILHCHYIDNWGSLLHFHILEHLDFFCSAKPQWTVPLISLSSPPQSLQIKVTEARE